jgi:hypothetical protein
MVTKGWLASTDGDIVKLLELLDVENDTAVCVDTVTELLKQGVMHFPSGPRLMFRAHYYWSLFPTDHYAVHHAADISGLRGSVHARLRQPIQRDRSLLASAL